MLWRLPGGSELSLSAKTPQATPPRAIDLATLTQLFTGRLGKRDHDGKPLSSWAHTAPWWHSQHSAQVSGGMVGKKAELTMAQHICCLTGDGGRGERKAEGERGDWTSSNRESCGGALTGHAGQRQSDKKERVTPVPTCTPAHPLTSAGMTDFPHAGELPGRLAGRRGG